MVRLQKGTHLFDDLLYGAQNTSVILQIATGGWQSFNHHGSPTMFDGVNVASQVIGGSTVAPQLFLSDSTLRFRSKQFDAKNSVQKLCRKYTKYT